MRKSQPSLGLANSRRVAAPRPSHRPILHLQSSHPPKPPLVVRHQRQPRRLRMRCNPQIIVPDHLPFALHFPPHRSIILPPSHRHPHPLPHFPPPPPPLHRRPR